MEDSLVEDSLVEDSIVKVEESKYLLEHIAKCQQMAMFRC
jgi:hypothetical protein